MGYQHDNMLKYKETNFGILSINLHKGVVPLVQSMDRDEIQTQHDM